MASSNSEQNPNRTTHKVESELDEIHECVRQGTNEADLGQVVSSEEVFRELRQRNAAEAKRSCK